MTLKVSVIVPTYQSGKGINRVIASIDAQTLPHDEFEVIFVDDGSPDDTFERLKAIRDARSYVSVVQIDNSGWPSRPRNVGIGLAQGEYVFFMDHDDQLYPDALVRSYEFAKSAGADILSPKESKSSNVAWSIPESRQNLSNGKGSRGIASLLPMVPHKFYRRDFILEHHIRFPEGRRMLWEDIYFNVEAYRYASVVSVLADTPVYKWIHTGTNNSSSYGPASEEYWDKLGRLFDFIVTTLPGDEFLAARDLMLTHQYRNRVLGRFANLLRRGNDTESAMALENAHRILADHVPERFDKKLGKLIQPRAFLLRARRIDLLTKLDQVDAGLAGHTVINEASWQEGKLVLATTTTWTTKDGLPPTLCRDGATVRRRLPADIEAALPVDSLDVTEGIARVSTEILIRSRHEQVTWALPTSCEVVFTPGIGETITVAVQARATVDISAAAFGRPLTGALWDFYATNNFLGVSNSSAIFSDATRSSIALLDGRSAIVYRNRDGKLSLDLEQRVRSILIDGEPLTAAASVRGGQLRLASFSLPLAGVDVEGDSVITGKVGLHVLRGVIARTASSEHLARLPKAGNLLTRLFALKPARIIGDISGARLEGVFRKVPGSYSLTCKFEGRLITTRIRVRVHLNGGVVWWLTHREAGDHDAAS